MLLISGYFGSLSLIVSAHAAFAKNGFSKLKRGMNEHLAAAATRCHQNRKQLAKTRRGPVLPILPSLQMPIHPTPPAHTVQAGAWAKLPTLCQEAIYRRK